MKLLFENNRYIISIFLTILMFFGTSMSGYANNAPVFTEGARAIRTIAENTAAGTNIGTPVAATDADGDVLTYSLGGVEGSPFFSINTDTGQLQTKAPLDYETKNTYSFSVFANDGNGGRVVILVTINVTDVDETPANNAPVFTDGSSTTRTIAENTVSGTNIGTPVAATDADSGDTLTYTLGGTDAASFRIVGTSGQLQTRAALDYETKTSYSVTVSVSDGNEGSASIDVAISVTDVNETPSFPTERATRTVVENTVSDTNIGDPLQATDPDSGDTLTYSLHRGDATAFRINPNTGQLRTKAALDFETKNLYNDLAIRATDSEGNFDAIFITINVTNVNEAPSFPAETATRSVAENTASGEAIGDPFQATDPDSGDTLTYSLHRGDATAFWIDPNTGQVRTHAALDFETKQVYNDLAIRATDSEGNFNAIFITINVTNVNEAPSFTEGSSTTRTIAENTASGTNIGELFQATDPEDDTINYTLGGDDASAFSIISTTGQLQTRAALDYETKRSYSVMVSASDDNGGRASIDVAISVTDVNENRAPVFSDGDSTTRTVAENTVSGQSIGTAVSATDADSGDTLTYTLSGTDAASFRIVSTSGQLQTLAALDYETDDSYSVTVSVSDGNGGSASIDVTISVTDINETPSFPAETATLTVAENTTSDTSIGEPFQATDPDNGDTLIYSLHRGDRFSFRIDPNTGQLQTRAALDFETKKVYNDLAIRATDSEGRFDAIFVTITVTNVNEAPVFTDSSSTTRAIAENTASGENIGEPVTATDPEDDTINYTLSGTDASAFSIISTTGQLQTLAALDYETKHSYSVMVSASDDNGGSASIDVSIRVTDVPENSAPVFADGDSTTRTVAENTASGENIGRAVAATDADSGDTLTYTLGGDDAEAFSIVRTTGQLQTSAALDYETKNAYTVTVSVFDDNGGSTSIDVSIRVTDVSENGAPVFSDGATTTRTIAENTASGTNIGEPVAATDPENDTINYTLGGDDAAAFSIVRASGQLQTRAALDFETKHSYSVTVSASDGNGGSPSISVTISVTDVNEAPSFPVDRATLTVAEDTAPGEAIGDSFQATDPDSEDTLIYSIHRGDAISFRIDPNTGQLRTHAALDFETKKVYNDLAIRATDSKGRRDVVLVTINVTNVNEVPRFTEGSSTTRVIAPNTVSGTNIGAAVAATDGDNDTLTYSLGGADASSFSIVSTSGQLQTSTALDEGSYSVTVSVSDNNGGSDSISVTINVVNSAPVFSDGTATTRVVAENTAANTNIGTPVAATDVDIGDTLTYSLGGDDASSFSIVSTSGQLQTSAALDYEIKHAYSVTVSVSDGNGGSDNITVTIYVSDVDEGGFVPVQSRSPAVRNAIVQAAHVWGAEDVTAAHLTGITELNISRPGTRDGAIDLQPGDFSGFTNLRRLSISGKVRGISGLSGLTNLEYLNLSSNRISDISALSGLTKLKWLYLSGNNISDLTPLSGLTNLEWLTLGANSITDISPLSGLTKLVTLHLHENYALSDISAVSGLTKLTELMLGSSSISDISAVSGLTKLEQLYLGFSRISDISAVSGLTKLRMLSVHNNDVSDISAVSGLTKLYWLYLENSIIHRNAVSSRDDETNQQAYERLVSYPTNSISDVSPLSGLTELYVLKIKNNPISDYSPIRTLRQNHALREFDINNLNNPNNPPVFTEGSSTTRTVAENTAANTNIGTAVAATDADTTDTLTYSLASTDDAESFSIVSTTGQLRTKVALDFETKNSYTVTVTVSDGNNSGDRIIVTIDIMDAAGAPSVETLPALPETTALLSNFPNPFNPETWIPYQLAKPADVTLTIYDIRGVVVRELKLGHQLAGMYHSRSRAIHWDGRNMFGEKVATGIYFYTLKAGDFTATRKLLIRK